MTHEEVQSIATKLCLGKVHFQFNVAQNTGRSFEVGYVSVARQRVLFCKRGVHTLADAFYLCNEFRKYDPENGRRNE